MLFCGLALYGWVTWTRGRREADGLVVRQATLKERIVLIGAILVGTAVVAELFTHLDWLQIAGSPWANAYIFVGSAVATFAQSRALVDFWIVWVLVDLVGSAGAQVRAVRLRRGLRDLLRDGDGRVQELAPGVPGTQTPGRRR